MDVEYVLFSDHRFIFVKIGHQAWRRGPGFWKVNQAVLGYQGVAEEVIDLIRDKEQEYIDLDPVVSWEILKLKLREHLSRRNREIIKERNALREELLEQITSITNQDNWEEIDIELVSDLRRELYALYP